MHIHYCGLFYLCGLTLFKADVKIYEISAYLCHFFIIVSVLLIKWKDTSIMSMIVKEKKSI